MDALLEECDNKVLIMQDDILMFGGGGGREGRPQYVQNEWSLATEFIKDYVGAVSHMLGMPCCSSPVQDGCHM